ncbi:MAG: DUF120 domain-containing protein [Bacteriovoracaceae bacterium]|jgi:riboflavin kinase, archaea type|nr:DUF120 domain-containing protein [Bacteriovoracaceae bacterium]
MKSKTILKGKVKTGKGHFSWVFENIEGLWDLYNKKSKLNLIPGSLNLELDHEFSIPSGSTRIEAHEYNGTVSASFYPCKVGHLNGIIIRADNNEKGIGAHPRKIIEIAAEKKLRDELDLGDGDEVIVTIEHS